MGNIIGRGIVEDRCEWSTIGRCVLQMSSNIRDPIIESPALKETRIHFLSARWTQKILIKKKLLTKNRLLTDLENIDHARIEGGFTLLSQVHAAGVCPHTHSQARFSRSASCLRFIASTLTLSPKWLLQVCCGTDHLWLHHRPEFFFQSFMYVKRSLKLAIHQSRSFRIRSKELVPSLH